MGWGEPHAPVCPACSPLSPEDLECAVEEFDRRRTGNPQPTDPEEGEA